MNKKTMIKIIGAAAIAGAAFVSTTSVHAASDTEVNKQVQKALDAGTVLKWAISVGGTADGKTRPWAQYNAAKDARAKAVATINTLPSAKRTVHLTKIQDGVDLHIERAMRYIDAITAGEKIKEKQSALEAKMIAGVMDDAAEKAYHELSFELKKQSVLLDKVYGQTTRDKIREQYKGAAEKVRNSAIYAVTVKMEIDLAKKALNANDQATFEKHVSIAEKNIASVTNNKMKNTLQQTLTELTGLVEDEEDVLEIIDIY